MSNQHPALDLMTAIPGTFTELCVSDMETEHPEAMLAVFLGKTVSEVARLFTETEASDRWSEVFVVTRTDIGNYAELPADLGPDEDIVKIRFNSPAVTEALGAMSVDIKPTEDGEPDATRFEVTCAANEEATENAGNLLIAAALSGDPPVPEESSIRSPADIEMQDSTYVHYTIALAAGDTRGLHELDRVYI